jgi:hypothetical protein
MFQQNILDMFKSLQKELSFNVPHVPLQLDAGSQNCATTNLKKTFLLS